MKLTTNSIRNIQINGEITVGQLIILQSVVYANMTMAKIRKILANQKINEIKPRIRYTT